MNDLMDVSEDDDRVTIPFTTRNGGRSLVDGTLVIPMAFDPPYAKQAFEFFGGLAGRPGVVVPLTQQAAQKHMRQQTIANYQAEVKQLQNQSKYGHFAALLDKSHFWHQLPVLKAAGPEKDYMAWCRKGPCGINAHHQGGQDMQKGQMPFEYHHVNHAGNSGTSIKNQQYWGFPVCHEDHHDFIGLQGCYTDYAWVKRLVEKHQHKWARETVKKTLGFDSWKDIHPDIFYQWAEKNKVDNLIPFNYKMQKEALNHV